MGKLGAAHRRATIALKEPREALVKSISSHSLPAKGETLHVTCAFSSDALYMKEGLRALRESTSETDLHIVFFAGGVVMVALSPHLGANHPDVVSFVEARGGGGRGRMGGFRFPQPIALEQYSQRRETLLKDLKEFWR
ncbi:MAG: hypothetical protein JRH20_28490 [Deltaproteobacteria bacterium]|nr:hypothetical protein [Deltaproteobacteria bacterium]